MTRQYSCLKDKVSEAQPSCKSILYQLVLNWCSACYDTRLTEILDTHKLRPKPRLAYLSSLFGGPRLSSFDSLRRFVCFVRAHQLLRKTPSTSIDLPIYCVNFETLLKTIASSAITIIIRYHGAFTAEDPGHGIGKESTKLLDTRDASNSP